MLGKGADSLLFNDFKNQTKEYNNYQIKSKDLLNQTLKNNNLLNQSSKIKSQSADYLIEYFEGMILNYISLAKERGEKLDELKNLILSHNKKNKFNGGSNNYLDNDPEYKNYINDDTKTNIDISLFDEYNWRIYRH